MVIYFMYKEMINSSENIHTDSTEIVVRNDKEIVVLNDKNLNSLVYPLVSWCIAKYFLDKDTVQEVTQEIVIKVWETLKNGNYKDNGTFNAWCCRVAYNYTMDFLRKKKNERQFFIDDVNDNKFLDSFAHESVEDQKINEDTKLELLNALSKLSPQQQEVITLRFYEEMLFKDIADQTKSSINTVLWRCRYACNNLLNILSNTNK